MKYGKIAGLALAAVAFVNATAAFAADTTPNYVWPGVGTLRWLLGLLG